MALDRTTYRNWDCKKVIIAEILRDSRNKDEDRKSCDVKEKNVFKKKKE